MNYSVFYDFAGFTPPVSGLPSLNPVKAGQNVPVKFSLHGDRGLAILAAGAPFSAQVECTTQAALAEPVTAVAAGATTLRYDPAADQYSWNCQTEKVWAASCRLFSLALDDGSVHTALFSFK